MVHPVTHLCFHFYLVIVRGGGAAPNCDLDKLHAKFSLCTFLSLFHSLFHSKFSI